MSNSINSNGGKEENYEWSQSLEEVVVLTPLPPTTTAKQLSVTIKPHLLSVKNTNTNCVIIEGPLHQPIVVDGSTWSLSTNSGSKSMEIVLEKRNKQAWWPCVIQGATQIDTSKIEPENSRLSDLPDDTRALVEKMMFDQQQKSRSQPRPQSQVQDKQQILANFKAAHPELDFSNAKIMDQQ